MVTASVLEAHYYIENNPLAQCGELNRYQTSGTSSKRRKAIYYSESDEEAYLRIKLDIFRTILGPNGFQSAMADMGTGHAEATAVEVFRRLNMEVESLSFQLPIEKHIERLTSFRPEVFYTMPSILERILLASDDPTAYGIRHVILVGEIASPGWIKRVSERMCIGMEQITDTYGSIEIGTIAYFSHQHGRYLLAEGLIGEGISPEKLGEELEPLKNEDEQVLVLTSTVRESFPALRYVTYDVVRDLRTIMVDDKPRQTFQSIVKRIGPDLKHGEKISIYDIEDVVYRHLGNASVRVKVVGNALRVYVYSVTETSLVLESIRYDLENCIPEIGLMIRAGILEGIQVIWAPFEDSQLRSSVKGKKIGYE
ncbi:CoF synthetase [Paenibacillus sp. SYP-B3998]|uniref:CoF synthetase n=1 Tax=Paenibacillus sp. SYP-B3998 TaxID=2678564 RepID=A0A6G4A2P3_9BACL|nr:CoF synthetase [Paenibacillus sp. SYP-B3998]